jgi:hypothetical protein
MTKKKSKLIWQRQGDAIIYNPPRSHPAYEEWQKLKEKEKEDNETTTD